jgi:flagellin
MLPIRSNVSSIGAQRNLNASQGAVDTSLGKLSSGFRITSASDDAAGLGVSTALSAQLRSFEQAARNADDGLSVVQTAEAGLNEATEILKRIRELAVQSASDGLTANERTFVQKENIQLQGELDRINATAEFNGTRVFGAASASTFQVGVRGDANDTLAVDTSGTVVDSATLLAAPVDLGVDAATSRAALQSIDDAINKVSGFRADLGAVAGRLTNASNTIAKAAEAVAASNSRIRDVDVAAETSRLSSAQILLQAGVAVLAQANQSQRSAFKLFNP